MWRSFSRFADPC